MLEQLDLGLELELLELGVGISGVDVRVQGKDYPLQLVRPLLEILDGHKQLWEGANHGVEITDLPPQLR